MSGVRGWREGSSYGMAGGTGQRPLPAPHLGQKGYLGANSNQTEEAGNSQQLMRSGEETRNQPSTYQQQQEQHVNSYVLITPNETRRNKLQQIAKKELDDLERWKETHRPGPIKLPPQRLGGEESEAQARQKQQMMFTQSKYQQKAERLEVKKRQQEMQRREMFLEDRFHKTNELLNRLDLGLPRNDSCQTANCGPESTAWHLFVSDTDSVHLVQIAVSNIT
uniref:Epithelial stromal interaction 1 n=1 Tax=Coturnix japonica TaxID=93934 RepID=A0A8C2UCS7_COTJA